MKLTPEIAMYIRDSMKYGGALLVALGYATAPETAAAASMLELAIPLLEAFAGLAMAIYAMVWARNAKKPVSQEAQVIAGRVEAHPTAEPIPPTPKEVSQ